MGTVTAIASKDKVAVRKPAQYDLEHLPHQQGWRFVATTLLFVFARAAIERHQDGQCPRATSEWKLHQDRQHHPLVPIAESGIGVGRAHGVAMPALAEDLLAAMLVDGVVARQLNRSRNGKVADKPGGQKVGQAPQRPTSFREQAMVTGRGSRRQGTKCAQQIQDGMVAGGQDRREQQNKEAVIGRSGEHLAEGAQEKTNGRRCSLLEAAKLTPSALLGFALPSLSPSRKFGMPALPVLGYTGHESLLAWNERARDIPSIPSRRLVFV